MQHNLYIYLKLVYTNKGLYIWLHMAIYIPK